MVKKRFRERSEILHAIRQWFRSNGYIEVHTPLRVGSPAMEEHLEAFQSEGKWLQTSPEFAMKRILAEEGLCRIFQIAPCFRKEELGVHHSSEFTMLEWYRVGIGTRELMQEAIQLIEAAASALGKTVSPFRIVASDDLLSPDLEPAEWFYRWVDEIEPTLDGPTIVFNYPKWQAALARISGKHADRFEIYLEGIELANAFHEELHSDQLRKRWLASNQEREKNGRKGHPLDERFLQAVDRMPRCAGIAMGIDRLVMALSGASHIGQTQLTEREESWT
jgi:elongation factor P--(R)-beta-lysine ligase